MSIRTNIQRPIPAPNYSRYEAMKREWYAKNPGATQAEIDAAMRSIAKKCGV